MGHQSISPVVTASSHGDCPSRVTTTSKGWLCSKQHWNGQLINLGN